MGSLWQLVHEPRFGCPGCKFMRGDHTEQFGVQSAVRGEDFPIIRTKHPAAHVGHGASGLRHYYGPSSDVPRRDALLPVSVEPASGDVAEIEGGGTCLPDGLNSHQE